MLGFHKNLKKVALVLGGGSARGVAHIGVLKVLEREKIPIDMIVGTSMGAVIGAAYAVGNSIDKMEKMACSISMNKLLDPTIPRMGLLSGAKLEIVIADILEGKGFKDCRIPLAVVATDIESNEEMIYTTGELAKIVRASCSWPGIFNPVRFGGRLIVDGGIKSSVPTNAAKSMGFEYIIAVDVGFCVKHGKIESILQMMLQSFQIMGHELNKHQARAADAVIDVELGDLDQTAFHRAREAIAKGQEAAEKKIAEIKKGIGLSI